MGITIYKFRGNIKQWFIKKTIKLASEHAIKKIKSKDGDIDKIMRDVMRNNKK